MSETRLFTVDAQGQGSRLDVFISEALEELTRSRVQKLLEMGCLRVNDKSVKAGYKLKEGDRISLEIPETRILSAEPQPMDIPIIYEDEDLAIVMKPRGLVVHPAAGHEDGTLVNGLMYAFEGRLSGINGVLRPGIVHRIDKDTSGLLVVCKSDRAHQVLSDKLKEHDIDRVYHTIVHGNIKEDRGTVDAPIGRMDNERKKMCIRPDGRRAVTHYRVLERYKGFTYLEVTLETGRTHQIRVHMQSLGHPVLGDPVYGPARQTTDPGRRLEKEDFWPGQILHAKVLGFEHPVSGEFIRFDSELPPYFLKTLEILRNYT
ncbi:MAG: RluA family pseudouridine synthase [Lachnospiraceae bacterium]|nr:RluA family pseudouridine synthase [Lachnospiraceae bacterium]